MDFEAYLTALRGKTVSVIGIGVSNRPLIEKLLEKGVAVTARDKKESLGELGAELAAQGCKLKHAIRMALVAAIYNLIMCASALVAFTIDNIANSLLQFYWFSIYLDTCKHRTDIFRVIIRVNLSVYKFHL